MTKRIPPYSPEVRARAVRMVFDHQGEHASQAAAISSIAAKIGCAPETLRHWVRQAERDQGRRAGPTTAEHERIRALEREVRELRQANEILRKASAYFAMAELTDRPGAYVAGIVEAARIGRRCDLNASVRGLVERVRGPAGRRSAPRSPPAQFGAERLRAGWGSARQPSRVRPNTDLGGRARDP